MAENTVELLDNARAHVTSNVPVVHPSETAAVIREHLHKQEYDSVTYLAVCERDQFLGLIRIKNLLPAAGIKASRSA